MRNANFLASLAVHGVSASCFKRVFEVLNLGGFVIAGPGDGDRHQSEMSDLEGDFV